MQTPDGGTPSLDLYSSDSLKPEKRLTTLFASSPLSSSLSPVGFTGQYLLSQTPSIGLC